jgi:RNA recognition motif-containing protein
LLRCRIRWASVNKANEEQDQQPNSFCLLVADLPPFITQDHLYSIFTVYGYLQSIEIKRSKGKKSPLPYAEVEYSDVSSAILAMKDLDGKLFMGQPFQ